MKEYPWGKGTPRWVRDATANDSDKSFTVPAGKIWDMVCIYQTIVCTATVGNRLPRVEITDGTDRVATMQSPGAVAASAASTSMYFFGMYGLNTAAPYGRLDTGASSSVNGNQIVFPRCVLPAGYVVHVWDTAAIDAAADDLTVVLHYVEYDA